MLTLFLELLPWALIFPTLAVWLPDLLPALSAWLLGYLIFRGWCHFRTCPSLRFTKAGFWVRDPVFCPCPSCQKAIHRGSKTRAWARAGRRYGPKRSLLAFLTRRRPTPYPNSPPESGAGESRKEAKTGPATWDPLGHYLAEHEEYLNGTRDYRDLKSWALSSSSGWTRPSVGLLLQNPRWRHCRLCSHYVESNEEKADDGAG
jgi:hypothetical protein